MIIKRGFGDVELMHNVPTYKMKRDFRPGTFSENEWQKGETACVDRHFYRLPNGSEWVVYTFAERTHTGMKKVRMEVWHNGQFHNNYFSNNYDDAVNSMENEIAFFGFEKNRAKYAL